MGADQATLAEKAGVTRQAVSVVETDESAKMDPRRRKVLESLQRVFEDEYGIEFFAASGEFRRGCSLPKVSDFASGHVSQRVSHSTDFNWLTFPKGGSYEFHQVDRGDGADDHSYRRRTTTIPKERRREHQRRRRN